MRIHHLAAVALLAGQACNMAQAAVTAEEAAKLKTELTPLGGERAGNKEGTIPAWTGGYTTPIPGDKPGGRRGDPFQAEKPLFSITAKNMDQYAAKLNDGSKALLKKYPDSYRIDVYPTHRTAAAPQYVYDNTFKNATRGKMVGDVPEGVFGGVPFPIPKTGAEAIWNHLLRWRGESEQYKFTHNQITADGKVVLATDGWVDEQVPYYFKEGNPEAFQKGGANFWYVKVTNIGPPIRNGEAIAGFANMDQSKNQAWVYLTGQRRVRKLPNPCCDAPAAPTAGLMNFDEVSVWDGRIDRFDWQLVGKTEMFIPYNSNRTLQPKTDAEVIGKAFVNPDYQRWELHRVWVIEANLRAGQRHSAPKSRYYCDEDTWLCLLADRWDANGQLWKTLWMNTYVVPDLPGTVSGAWGANDLLSGTAFVGNLYTGQSSHYVIKPRYPESTFSPEALAGDSVR